LRVEADLLLERLPWPQQGRLIHLEGNDHYVDVTTDRGASLVLIRLSDAIRETAPVPGVQVPRSHRVALGAVRRSIRLAGKPVLEVENGVVPISLGYLTVAKDAGLFA
jgi:DNA-binding LytR/AlgR family response regulator